jgi:hypothetical protein
MRGQLVVIEKKGTEKSLFCKLDPKKKRIVAQKSESSLIAALSLDLVRERMFWDFFWFFDILRRTCMLLLVHRCKT